VLDHLDTTLGDDIKPVRGVALPEEILTCPDSAFHRHPGKAVKLIGAEPGKHDRLAEETYLFHQNNMLPAAAGFGKALAFAGVNGKRYNSGSLKPAIQPPSPHASFPKNIPAGIENWQVEQQ
jgi:hypothetical protein